MNSLSGKEPKKNFIDLFRDSMSEEQRVQADKVNAAFFSAKELRKQYVDLGEQLDIANAVLRREERIWKDMIEKEKPD